MTPQLSDMFNFEGSETRENRSINILQHFSSDISLQEFPGWKSSTLSSIEYSRTKKIYSKLWFARLLQNGHYVTDDAMYRTHADMTGGV